MVHVRFTENLRRHVDCADGEVFDDVPVGATVRACLDAYFEDHPDVRSYVLDDQGAVRNHVVVFLDGAPIDDRTAQTDAVRAGAEIVVMQALSGG
ncbi:MAG: MoaD/ThiS family protein [Planctomycetota bacterium]